jgi:hypothetical protein
MNTKTIAIAIAAVAAWGTPAHADTVAGWDFSQYLSDGVPSVDGTTLTSELDANYSSFAPTFNAGAESAAFGKLTINGSALPTAGSLQSNLDGPADEIGENSFDSLTILAFEGQPFQELMSITAIGSATLTFETDLSGASATGRDWRVSFGGKTFDDPSCSPSCSASVSVEFSSDGSSYTSFGSVQLDSSDTQFSVALSAAESATGVVRLGLDSANGQPILDNVAVIATVPEPGATLALLSGSALLVILRRRRG